MKDVDCVGLPRRLPAACGLILVNMAADGRAKFTP
jgi:hypothetical protein